MLKLQELVRATGYTTFLVGKKFKARWGKSRDRRGRGEFGCDYRPMDWDQEVTMARNQGLTR